MKKRPLTASLAVALWFVSGCEKSNESTIKEQPWNPTDEDLFADDYFDKYVDPVSGVVSYWFKSELKEFPNKYNTQSTYFVAKSMTDDLRFCYSLFLPKRRTDVFRPNVAPECSTSRSASFILSPGMTDAIRILTIRQTYSTTMR